MAVLPPGSRSTMILSDRYTPKDLGKASHIVTEGPYDYLPEGGTRPVPVWSLAVVVTGPDGPVTFTNDGDFETWGRIVTVDLQVVGVPSDEAIYSWSLSTENWIWVDNVSGEVPAPGSDQTTGTLNEAEHGDEVLTVAVTIGDVTHTIEINLVYTGS